MRHITLLVSTLITGSIGFAQIVPLQVTPQLGSGETVKQCFYIEDANDGEELFWGYNPNPIDLPVGNYRVGIVKDGTPQEIELALVEGTETIVLDALPEAFPDAIDSRVPVQLEFEVVLEGETKLLNNVNVELCRVSGPGYVNETLSSNNVINLATGKWLRRIKANGILPKRDDLLVVRGLTETRVQLDYANLPLMGGIYNEGQLEGSRVKAANQHLILSFANGKFDDLDAQIQLNIEGPLDAEERVSLEATVEGRDLKKYYLLRKTGAQLGNYLYNASWAEITGVSNEFPVAEAKLGLLKNLSVSNISKTQVTLKWNHPKDETWYQVELFDAASFETEDGEPLQVSEQIKPNDLQITSKRENLSLAPGDYVACVIITNWSFNGDGEQSISQPEASRTCTPFVVSENDNQDSGVPPPGPDPGPIDDDPKPKPIGDDPKPDPIDDAPKPDPIP